MGSPLDKDAVLNARLRPDQPGRTFHRADGIRWGELIEAALTFGVRVYTGEVKCDWVLVRS